MNTIEKAVKIAKMFIDYVKENNSSAMEEIKITSDQPNEHYTVKIFITENQDEVIFKKDSTNSYIIISNGHPLGIKGAEDFTELFSLLEIAGVKLLEKTIKRPRRKKKKSIGLKKRKKEDEKQKMDRLLDRYNDYQQLYEVFGDEKYLKRKERLIKLLKKHR